MLVNYISYIFGNLGNSCQSLNMYTKLFVNKKIEIQTSMQIVLFWITFKTNEKLIVKKRSLYYPLDRKALKQYRAIDISTSYEPPDM